MTNAAIAMVRVSMRSSLRSIARWRAPVHRRSGDLEMKIPAIFTNAAIHQRERSDPRALRRDGWITELQQAGVIEQLYLKADRSGAVIILEAQSAQDAQRHPATLPPRSWA
jgi:hypothetical protein